MPKAVLSFKNYKPLSLRIWHWLNALTVSLLLLTVFLRQTFLNAKDNARLMVANGISEDLAKQLARTIRDEMFGWHFRLGIFMAILFLARIIVGMITKENPFQSALRGYKEGQREYFAVKAFYSLFYVFLAVMVFTGLTMYYGKEIGLLDPTIHQIKEIHEPLMWFFPGFIALHLMGTIYAELTHSKGIVSDMFHGGDRTL